MLATVCAIPLAFLAEVELRGEILRLGDVADLSALPGGMARGVGATALLRVDRDLPQTAIPRAELAAQTSARLPLLTGCFAAAGAPVVIRRKPAEATPRVHAVDPAGIARGERVGVRIASGPFAIERGGIAESAARPGERLFVRTTDGQVVRAVVEGAMP